ncbi:MAG: hypothetical protein ACK5IR_11300 [Tropicimonas sp.]
MISFLPRGGPDGAGCVPHIPRAMAESPDFAQKMAPDDQHSALTDFLLHT